jgi:hypothetical protein
MRSDVCFAWIYVRPKCVIPITWCTETSSFVWLRMYESLRTCAVRNRSCRRSASRFYYVRTSDYLLLNALDILRRNSVGYLCGTWRWRTWILEPSLVWVAVRSGWWQASPSLLTPASGPFSETRHFSWDMFPANTMAYDKDVWSGLRLISASNMT